MRNAEDKIIAVTKLMPCKNRSLTKRGSSKVKTGHFPSYPDM